jgi:hypothetical protein
MFVHDFVHVDRPLDDVLGHFGARVDPWLPTLLSSAYETDRAVWCEAGIAASDLRAAPTVAILLGRPRVRADGVVLPISWPPRPATMVAGRDADLEIASCGPNRTDIHLLGRYEFGNDIDRWSQEGSLASRVTVTAVRRFLELLALHLEEQELQDDIGFTSRP